MKITTKTIYAVKALVELAQQQKQFNKPILLKDIAQKRDISQRYLENIFTRLRASGILKSTQGKNGGFLINEDLTKLTLYDIILSLEEPIIDVNEMEDNFSKNVWKEINFLTEKLFKEYSLEKLIKKDNETNDLEFYI